MIHDPRLTLARPDLARVELQGRVAAAAYAAVSPMQARAPVTAIRRAAQSGSEQMDQLLFGEGFDVLEIRDGWAFGQARRDGYVGHVALEGLAAPGPVATHWVSALRTYAFAEPSIKTPPVPYSLGSLVAVEDREGRFVKVAGAGWFIEGHLAPVGLGFETDAAAVAERFLHAPYQWGGRESLGLDCSGLILQALLACGYACPRDTDQQERAFAEIGRGDLGRGDLVFWPGHVAMMLDANRMIHANAFHMKVAIEPLDPAIARIEAAGSGAVSSFRRPPGVA